MWPFTNVSDEQILSAVGAWMLACAVGAESRTLHRGGAIDFETWFWLCEGTWVPKVRKKLGVSTRRIRRVVQAYAKKNRHRTINDVFAEESRLRPSEGGDGILLGPGESVRVRVEVQTEPHITETPAQN